MIKSGLFRVLWLVLFTASKSFAESGDHSTDINSFDLPGQTLQSALIEFALQANITVIADNDIIQGYQSTPIAGPRKIDDALITLLSNTPLTYQYQPETHSFVIQHKAPGHEDGFLVRDVEEIIVTGLRYPFRYHTIANTQLQNGMSYFDSARFLNLVPQTLIEDHHPTDLASVLKYVSGITPGDGISDSNDDIVIRGFQRHAIYVDGFRLGESTGIKLLPANIERIEILKGPSTLLYGQAEPGGIVNVIRKTPQGKTFLHTEAGVGNDGQQQLNIDVNSQLPGMAGLNYRVVLADERQDKASEISDIHKQLVAPSMTWQWSENTTLHFGYEWQYAEQIWNRNEQVFLPYDDIFDGATLDNVGQQARPDFNTTFHLYNAEFNHYITPDWRFRAKYFWQDEERFGIRNSTEAMLKTNTLFKREELGANFQLLTPGGQIALPIIIEPQLPEAFYSIGKIRTLYDEEAAETANHISFNIEGSFDALAMVHHVTFGGDWHQQDIYKKYTVEVRDLFPAQRWKKSEFSLPHIAETIFDPNQPLGIFEYQELRLLYDDYGFYAQDNIELDERWVVSAGTRYTITTGEHADITHWVFTELKTYKNFSSQLGLVYKPTDNYSVFANYSEALRANYHIDDIGSEIAEPELSDQFEIGVKSYLLDGKFLSGIALFEINKRNIVDLRIIDGIRTSLAAHEQQVRGLDLDFTFQASTKLNLVGSMAFIDPEIMSGIYAGKSPALAAEKTASLFLHYRLRDDLAISSGAKYVSERFGDDENRFLLAAYSTVDVDLAYDLNVYATKVRFQFSVKNILDENYYTAIVDGVRKNAAEGRTFMGSVKVEL